MEEDIFIFNKNTAAQYKNFSTPKSLKNWTKVICNEGFYLQANILTKNGFSHGFFTSQWKTKGPTELANYIRKGTSVHFLKQVHGKKVINASNADIQKTKEADGLISNLSMQSLWIASADCIPILFADCMTGQVAACHAGWRGLASNIPGEVLKKMEYSGSKKESILVAMGPAISGQNYEVDERVATEIINWEGPASSRSLEGVPRQDNNSPSYIHKNSSTNFNVDIRLVAAEQLINYGLKVSQVSICSLCTFAEPNLFFSWRREKLKKVQWSGIISKDNFQD